jgi:hypothetical protein
MSEFENRDSCEDGEEKQPPEGNREEHPSGGQQESRPMSGQQVGAENVKRLDEYLAELRSTGGKLPMRNGKPDKSTIAMACGFNRQTLYNNPAAVALIEGATDLLGTPDVEVCGSEESKVEGKERAGNGKAAHLQQQVDRVSRRIQRLEAKLQATTVERDDLKRQLGEKDELLRRYNIFEELITTNGRKFRP